MSRVLRQITVIYSSGPLLPIIEMAISSLSRPVHIGAAHVRDIFVTDIVLEDEDGGVIDQRTRMRGLGYGRGQGECDVWRIVR